MQLNSPRVYCVCRHKTVAFLECDVGQTEFTPFGVISITFVSQPLIGKYKNLLNSVCIYI